MDQQSRAAAPLRRVAKACKQCAKSRLRCDGHYPCARCLSKDVVCTYTPGTDDRSTKHRHGQRSTLRGDDVVSSSAGIGESEPLMDWSINPFEIPKVQVTAKQMGQTIDDHWQACISEQRSVALMKFPDEDTRNPSVVDLPNVGDMNSSSQSLFSEEFLWSADLGILDGMPNDQTIYGRSAGDCFVGGVRHSSPLTCLPAPAQNTNSGRAGETRWPFRWTPRENDSVHNFPDQSGEIEDVYDIENFAHVSTMSPGCYDTIESFFHHSGEIGGNPLLETKLPPFEAMNSFIQLYFEYFHPGFPILHRPTFDTSTAPWVLVLSVAALGCRYSLSRSSDQYGNLLQGMLRRAISHTVRRFCSQNLPACCEIPSSWLTIHTLF